MFCWSILCHRQFQKVSASVGRHFNICGCVYDEVTQECEKTSTKMDIVVYFVGEWRRVELKPFCLYTYDIHFRGTGMALEWVGERRPNKALVCSDSVSVLCSIRSGTSYSRQDLLYEIMSVHTAI